MQILITGASGTIGLQLVKTLSSLGHQTIGLGRSDVDISSEDAVSEFLNSKHIDCVFHLAKADEAYTTMLLTYAKQKRIPFVFTSTYKVFSGKVVTAPYQEFDRPDAFDDFATYKINLEKLVLDFYPEKAYVIRLAWQIGQQPGGYNMLSFIKDQMDKKGVFQVSKHLYLSAMFIEDTCESMIDIVENYLPGLYHLEGNDGFSFYDIAYFLKHERGQDWIVLDDSKKFSKNDVMENSKVKVKTLSQYQMIHHS